MQKKISVCSAIQSHPPPRPHPLRPKSLCSTAPPQLTKRTNDSRWGGGGSREPSGRACCYSHSSTTTFFSSFTEQAKRTKKGKKNKTHRLFHPIKSTEIHRSVRTHTTHTKDGWKPAFSTIVGPWKVQSRNGKLYNSWWKKNKRQIYAGEIKNALAKRGLIRLSIVRHQRVPPTSNVPRFRHYHKTCPCHPTQRRHYADKVGGWRPWLTMARLTGRKIRNADEKQTKVQQRTTNKRLPKR